jgi:hypothetical protein
MSQHDGSSQDRYDAIVDALLTEPDVTFGPPGSGFGSTALKVHNKIFAMLVEDRLVVKLPRQRVDSLVTAGAGERFDPGSGRTMKEWVGVAPTTAEDWLSLAREARTFVAAQQVRKARLTSR